MMNAVVYERYGSPDVLRLVAVDKPWPTDGEVLVRVRAASVNPLDWHLVRGEPYILRASFGLRRPKRGRPGVDMAGEVEAVGTGVTRFQKGDRVFGACDAAFAEYVCAPEKEVAQQPANVSFEQAACVPVAGLTALQGLRDQGKLQAGQRVLINGAAGGVGTFAVQIAKWMGAEVTGVCSRRNVEMVRSLGADDVVDYTREDFTRGGPRYDVMFDCASTRSFLACRRALKPGGRYILVGAARAGRWIDPLPRILTSFVISTFVTQRGAFFVSKRSQEDLEVLRDLLAAGRIVPVIDRRYPLGDIAEAVRYSEAGHAQGKIVVTIG